MKKFFKFLMVAVVMSAAVVSCTKEPVDKPVNPAPAGTLVSKAKTGEGVTITATNISASDFGITTEMGIDCQTYRFDVMQLIRFQNFFKEAQKENPDLTEEEYAIKLLFKGDGTGGYGMQAPFDDMWGQSQYKQADIVNGTKYIVLTCGCIDAEATEVGEVNMLVVPLLKEPLEGNPEVSVGMTVGNYGYIADYQMNPDCYGYYSMETDTDAVDEALAWFGEDGLRDLIPSFQISPYTESGEVSKSWPYLNVQGKRVSAIAVAIDVNGTLAPKFVRADGVLPPIPPTPPGEYTMTIPEDLISAFTATSIWTVNWDVTRRCHYRIYPKKAWPDVLKGMTEEDLCLDMAVNGGWVILKDWVDPLTGKVNEFMWGNDIQPDSEYVLASTCTNKVLQFTKLITTEFKTKPLIENKQDQSLAQVDAQLTDITKTTVKAVYTIPEGTTLYWDRMLEKGSQHHTTGHDLTDPAYEKELIEYMLTSNVTAANYKKPFTFTGLEPGKIYSYFIFGEDIHGLLGPLKRYEFSTLANAGGPNPDVTITGEVRKRAGGGYEWRTNFEVNQDVTSMRYCCYDDKNAVFGTTPSEAVKNAWQDVVLGEIGLQTISSTGLTSVVTEYSTIVALAVTYGAQDKQGPFRYLIFNPALIMSSQLPAKAFSLPQYGTIPESISKYKRYSLYSDHK